MNEITQKITDALGQHTHKLELIYPILAIPVILIGFCTIFNITLISPQAAILGIQLILFIYIGIAFLLFVIVSAQKDLGNIRSRELQEYLRYTRDFYIRFVAMNAVAILVVWTISSKMELIYLGGFISILLGILIGYIILRNTIISTMGK